MLGATTPPTGSVEESLDDRERRKHDWRRQDHPRWQDDGLRDDRVCESRETGWRTKPASVRPARQRRFRPRASARQSWYSRTRRTTFRRRWVIASTETNCLGGFRPHFEDRPGRPADGDSRARARAAATNKRRSSALRQRRVLPASSHVWRAVATGPHLRSLGAS